jgi:hypothetical protein
MAIFGGGGRMNAYGEPLVDSTVGEALGGLLGRGASYLGEKFKDSLFDDKGLVRANPDGPGMPVLGKQKGFDDKTKKAYQDFRSKLYDDEGLFRASPDGPDRFIMGKKKGIDILDGEVYLGKKPGLDKPFLGEKPGFDKPYLGNLLGGVGSRLRTMFAKDPDEFTKAGGGTYNTNVIDEDGDVFNPQEVYSMLKEGMQLEDFENPKDVGMLQQLLRSEGKYEGPIDAIAGPKTKAGFIEFMKERGLYKDPSQAYFEGDASSLRGKLGRNI